MRRVDEPVGRADPAYDASELGSAGTEIRAYGIAVKATRVGG